MSRFANTPEPPYYAVIFTSQHSGVDQDEYANMADKMLELAKTMPGYLGAESARDNDGLGITVSYWRDEASIANWKSHAEHVEAREKGNHKWYDHFELRVARVERSYNGPQHKAAKP